MTIAEHLIENAIYEYERNKDYNNFMKNKTLIEQSDKIGITMSALWEMVQYIFYNYKPNIIQETKEKIVKDYGYDIYEDEGE